MLTTISERETMEFSEDDLTLRKRSTIIMLSFAAAEVLLHLYTNAFAGYGYFRDELYYIACSRHLAAGYVDQPPLSSVILFISVKLFGDSVFALRLLPAIVSGITVFLGGLIARKLGGGPSAIALACLSITIAPEFLGTNAIFSMNGFDWLFWSLAVYILVLIIENESADEKKESGKLWIWLGIVLGIGLLNKIDVLWLGSGMFVGLLLTPQRKHLATKWPYISGVLALVLFSPYIIWNFTHNFATLEFIHRASSIKYSSQNPVIFITDTIKSLNSWSLPVWLAGMWFLIFNKEGKRFRLIGFIFVVTFFILIINWHSKAEYIAPAFPIVFAAGGVMFERIGSHKWFAWTKYAMPALVTFYGLVSLPFALPILPVDSFIKYSSALGVKPSSSEAQHLSDLPQWYADMFG
ncbi:MAG: glycosyltransferase family 39 protein, partial [Candidatus Kryptoniota bacterium]